MNLDGFFKPESIAIVGASRKEGSLGRVFFDNVIKFGYSGKLYPVNPKTPDIGGVECFASIGDIPEVADVAVILVRKELALEAVAGCGEKGIKNIIMITAGFREVGGEGVRREKELLELIRKYDMRMIGPNCMGLINTDPDVKLNASFSPTEPYEGNVAFLSQSGALGVAVLEMSKTLRLGFSLFISEGNKADLNDADFLEYLADHEPTSVVTLYQESIEETDRFRKVVSQLSRRKPVIAVKAGRSARGARAASSHTGALASSDVATDAFFRQCGIIRADSIEELFELALAFSNQPLPGGKQVAVITNAGGPGILATDAIESHSLEMASLSDETKDKLMKILPEEASVNNPVDMIASANDETFRDTLKIVLNDKNVDAVMVIIVRPPVNTTPAMIAEAFQNVINGGKKKPVFTVLMAQQDESCGLDVFQSMKLPIYSYPESAARTIARMAQYRDWRKQNSSKVSKYDLDKGGLIPVFEQAAAEKREYLRNKEVTTLLEAYGFPLPFSAIIQSANEAVEIYKNLGKPLVLKIESDDIIHKSDVGAVRINLDTAESVRSGFEEVMENALKVTTPDRITGVLVQEMITSEREVALGMSRDPNYGPMIMFGLGGIFVEVFRDVSFRIAPVTEQESLQMIEEIRASKILKGFRGEAGVDLDFLADAIRRLSQLALDWPQILEMDINPLRVGPVADACRVVDARVRIKTD